MKTEAELEHLKKNWLDDPLWDIETTDGFEDHRDDLLAFRLEQERKWNADAAQELQEKSALLGVDGRIANYLHTYQRINAETVEEEARGLQVSLTHATLLLAAQVQRIADSLDRREAADENSRNVEDVRELYRGPSL